MVTRSAWLVCVLLFAGCAKRTLVIPDYRIPHQLAEASNATIWVRKEPGKWVKQEVSIPAGWWVAGPEVVEGPPTPGTPP